MPNDAPPSPLASPDAWNLVAPAYALEIVPMFEVYARTALDLACVTAGASVVDVASGPGTLSFLAAGRGARVSALDFSTEMLDRLRARLEREGVTAIDARLGDGMALPYPDGAFDAGFSMFGLMFFPDRDKGFRELGRVLRSGAKAVVSSWVDFERVPFLSAIFGVLGEVGPKPSAPPPPRRPLPLIDPATCAAEMRAGGFVDVEVREVVGTTRYESTEAMLDSFVRTSAPVVLMRRGLGEAWAPLEAAWKARVVERFGAGPQEVPMPANLTVGTRP